MKTPCLLLALLLSSHALLAVPSPFPAPPITPEGDGLVSGRLLDHDGNPLPGREVTCTRLGYEPQYDYSQYQRFFTEFVDHDGDPLVAPELYGQDETVYVATAQCKVKSERSWTVLTDQEGVYRCEVAGPHFGERGCVRGRCERTAGTAWSCGDEIGFPLPSLHRGIEVTVTAPGSETTSRVCNSQHCESGLDLRNAPALISSSGAVWARRVGAPGPNNIVWLEGTDLNNSRSSTDALALLANSRLGAVDSTGPNVADNLLDYLKIHGYTLWQLQFEDGRLPLYGPEEDGSLGVVYQAMELVDLIAEQARAESCHDEARVVVGGSGAGGTAALMGAARWCRGDFVGTGERQLRAGCDPIAAVFADDAPLRGATVPVALQKYLREVLRPRPLAGALATVDRALALGSPMATELLRQTVPPGCFNGCFTLDNSCEGTFIAPTTCDSRSWGPPGLSPIEPDFQIPISIGGPKPDVDPLLQVSPGTPPNYVLEDFDVVPCEPFSGAFEGVQEWAWGGPEDSVVPRRAGQPLPALALAHAGRLQSASPNRSIFDVRFDGPGAFGPLASAWKGKAHEMFPHSTGGGFAEEAPASQYTLPEIRDFSQYMSCQLAEIGGWFFTLGIHGIGSVDIDVSSRPFGFVPVASALGLDPDEPLPEAELASRMAAWSDWTLGAGVIEAGPEGTEFVSAQGPLSPRGARAFLAFVHNQLKGRRDATPIVHPLLPRQPANGDFIWGTTEIWGNHIDENGDEVVAGRPGC